MTRPHDPEEVLFAFAVEPNHDRDTLERYLRRYPDLGEELIDLSTQLRLARASGVSPVSVIADAGSEAAWQEFLGCQQQGVNTGEVLNPIAQFRGEAFANLADALNIPRSFLTGLRDGLVEAASVPDRFIRRMAEAMNASVDLIREHFENPRTASVARAFKSKEKPSHQGQITFQELVQRTEMSEEQRQLLLQDCNDDGLDRG